MFCTFVCMDVMYIWIKHVSYVAPTIRLSLSTVTDRTTGEDMLMSANKKRLWRAKWGREDEKKKKTYFQENKYLKISKMLKIVV